MAASEALVWMAMTGVNCMAKLRWLKDFGWGGG